MRQKTILDEVDDFDFNSDVDTDFEDSFPVEISNEVTFTFIMTSSWSDSEVWRIVSKFINYIAQVLLNDTHLRR